MTHEPECQSFDGGHTCICDVIRPAYQRGREDAANAVKDRLRLVWGNYLDDYPLIAAARGDGEQG